MFGLSWGQIGIILLVAVFVLGPERIPTAVAGALTAARRIRALIAEAQADPLGQFGSEIAQLRHQLAELQDLTGISELRELDPQRALASMAPSGETSTTEQMVEQAVLAVDQPGIR
jgi:sec-independent protein translocase protein TatB